MSADSDWQVYLLRCADGSLYAGVTRDLARRLRQHNGELTGGARYTRARRPVELAWSRCAADRAEAQRLEAAIKAMSRAQKLRLVSWSQAPGTPASPAASASDLPAQTPTAAAAPHV